MASVDTELEERLLEAGNKLMDPPSSVEELLPLLDQVESCLSRVEQSPKDSMQNALSPSFKALMADKLLRHSDGDVKVTVASCISEITRITAPDAPYDDDQMKEIFRLIVSSFENLHEESSRSYVKRTSILETVAKVRSCVVMLDLECDALILEMFQHFFKAIREHHPEVVFSSMETIMTLVLEESEDISLDLLSPLLASIKNDNEEILPIARNLGERVLESCATKLRPYLIQAVKALSICVDDYSTVLASICQDTSDGLEKNDEDKSESAKRPLQELTQDVKKDTREATSSQQGYPDENRSPKSVMSNGVVCAGEDNAFADSESTKKQEDADCSNHSKGLNSSGHGVLNDLDSEKVESNKQKPDQTTKRRRKKSSSSTKSAQSTKGQVTANKKKAEEMLDSDSHRKEVPDSPCDEHLVDAAGPSENNKEIDDKISSPKVGDNESEVVAIPSPNESLHDKNSSEKLGRAKMKGGPAKEVVAEDVSKVSEGASDSETKPARRPVKKALRQNSNVKKTTAADSVRKGSGTARDEDAKKLSAKKLEERKKGGSGSSSKQMEDKKKRGRGKAYSETDLIKSFAIDVDKEMAFPRSGLTINKDENSEEAPKTNVKRVRTPGKENESGIKEYGENLVGLRVEVWWPEDREFYKGVIDSFDLAEKKHVVLYEDGDQEVLNLVKEKWKIIKADLDAEGGEGSHPVNLVASTDMPPKKKVKTSAGESTKQGKIDASSRSGGAATASRRSKDVSMKSTHRSKDGNKSKDSKTISKSGNEVSGNSKDSTPKSGSSKSIVAAKKISSKSKNSNASKMGESKDDDISTSKPSAKSKQETPRNGKSKQETPKAATSKGKPPKSGGKFDVNGSGKAKSGFLKRKDSENENTDVSARGLDDTKGKTSSSSKAQGSEAKSGKKRRRS